MSLQPPPMLAALALALAVAGCQPAGDGRPPSAAAPAAGPPAAVPAHAAVAAPAATPGDGDSQGDAMVAGTRYHATAQVRCAVERGAPAGLCDAGVTRGTETGTSVEVTLPDGRTRTLFFNADGSFLAFATAEADGTAAMTSDARRDGDTTIATLGSERYEIPDAFVLGD